MIRASMAMEIEIMAIIGEHPNLGVLQEIFETEEQLQLVIPYYGNYDLLTFSTNTLMKQGFFREADAAKLLKDLFIGLAFLHKKDILHRDIKQANLMVVTTDEGTQYRQYPGPCTLFSFSNPSRHVIGNHRVVLIDFGLAVHCTDSTILKDEEGTHNFMPPEMVKKQGYGKPMDNWAAGVIAFTLVQGAPPFSTEERTKNKKKKDLFNKIANQEPAWTYPLSKSAKSFLQGMLEKDQTKRFTAMDALKHPWLRDPPTHPIATEVLSGWHTLSRSSRLAEATTQLLAYRLSEVEVRRARKAFSELDSEGTGYLTYDQVISVMASGADSEEETASRRQKDLAILATIDLDGDGKIEFSEFVHAYIEERMINEAKALFSSWDSNGDGFIDLNELTQQLCEYGYNAEDVKAMLEEADGNSDGQVSYKEFEELFNDDVTDVRGLNARLSTTEDDTGMSGVSPGILSSLGSSYNEDDASSSTQMPRRISSIKRDRAASIIPEGDIAGLLRVSSHNAKKMISAEQESNQMEKKMALSPPTKPIESLGGDLLDLDLEGVSTPMGVGNSDSQTPIGSSNSLLTLSPSTKEIRREMAPHLEMRRSHTAKTKDLIAQLHCTHVTELERLHDEVQGIMNEVKELCRKFQASLFPRKKEGLRKDILGRLALINARKMTYRRKYNMALHEGLSPKQEKMYAMGRWDAMIEEAHFILQGHSPHKSNLTSHGNKSGAGHNVLLRGKSRHNVLTGVKADRSAFHAAAQRAETTEDDPSDQHEHTNVLMGVAGDKLAFERAQARAAGEESSDDDEHHNVLAGVAGDRSAFEAAAARD